MSSFKSAAKDAHAVILRINKVAASNSTEEWQRVHSYIADCLKDASMLYAKLSRLQGDFDGKELDDLRSISENVLRVGDDLSAFSKAFYEGRYEMVDMKTPGSPQPVPTPPENQEKPAPEPPRPFSSDRKEEIDYSANEEETSESDSEEEKEEDYSMDEEESK